MIRGVNVARPHTWAAWSTSSGVGSNAMQILCFIEANRPAALIFFVGGCI